MTTTHENVLTHIDPVPATPCQTSGGQPHFSRGDRHMYSHHPSASAHTPQPGTIDNHFQKLPFAYSNLTLYIPFLLVVPTTSSLPLQGSNWNPQHSLGIHSAGAPGYPPGYPPGINTSTPVTVPGDTHISQMHYPGNHSYSTSHIPFWCSGGHCFWINYPTFEQEIIPTSIRNT